MKHKFGGLAGGIPAGLGNGSVFPKKLQRFQEKTTTTFPEKTKEQRDLEKRLEDYLKKQLDLEKKIRKDVRSGDAESLLRHHRSLLYYDKKICKISKRITELDVKRYEYEEGQ